MRDKFVTSSLAVHSLPRALLSPTRLAPCHAFHAIATSMLTARNRAVANCAALALVMLVVLFADVAWAFTFEDVAQRAKTLAAASFKTIKNDLPAEVRDLTYDQYRDIRFKSDQALWRAARLPFEVAFFHQGLFFNDRIKVNELAADGVREIKFSPELFDYGLNKLDPRKMGGLGFAGFRVHYPLNTPKYKDEVVVFLGAFAIGAVRRTARQCELFPRAGQGTAVRDLGPRRRC